MTYDEVQLGLGSHSMSSFDEAFQAHTDERNAQDVQKNSTEEVRRQNAERIIPLLTALLDELLERLSIESVQPCQVWVGNEWSPAGYVMSESCHRTTNELTDLVIVTLDRKIFRYRSATNRLVFVPVTAESIVRGKMPFIDHLPGDAAGKNTANADSEREDWERFEDDLTNILAGAAARIVQESRGRLRSNTKRRRPQPKTRLDEKIDKLKAEIGALQRSIEAEEARNRTNGKPSHSRAVGRMKDKLSRLEAKRNRLAEKNRPPR